MMLPELFRPVPDFLRQTAALLRHEPDILRQLPESFRDVPDFLRQSPNHSGTRRNSSDNCQSFPEVCRNHSDTPKTFKNPGFCPIYPKILAEMPRRHAELSFIHH
jgi:hypothetical protein